VKKIVDKIKISSLDFKY